MAKEEYMAAAEAIKKNEALWLTTLVKKIGVEQGGVELHCGCHKFDK